MSRRKPLPPREPDAQVDLHGLPPDRALRALSRELHGARLRRIETVLVITGKGWGNREQKPVLREKVEAWLRGADGARLGVDSVRVEDHGGALRVHLRRDANARPSTDPSDDPAWDHDDDTPHRKG